MFEHLADLETELEKLESQLPELYAGGDQANHWPGDLFEMYRRYAELRGWGLEVLSNQPPDTGGYRDNTFVVKGYEAWAQLKHEAGPHRVQRAPTTESQGRVHTSAATV